MTKAEIPAIEQRNTNFPVLFLQAASKDGVFSQECATRMGALGTNEAALTEHRQRLDGIRFQYVEGIVDEATCKTLLASLREDVMGLPIDAFDAGTGQILTKMAGGDPTPS